MVQSLVSNFVFIRFACTNTLHLSGHYADINALNTNLQLGNKAVKVHCIDSIPSFIKQNFDVIRKFMKTK